MIVIFTFLDQKRARPPLLLLGLIVQSTTKLEKVLPKDLLLSKKSDFWSLVSDRKIRSG
jgi:hypothetical protein